jgi:hypothetical protein
MVDAIHLPLYISQMFKYVNYDISTLRGLLLFISTCREPFIL